MCSTVTLWHVALFQHLDSFTFPPLITPCCTSFAKGWERVHTTIGRANAMKSKGHTRPPSSLEATRWYIKFRSDHQPNIEKMISHNINKLKQHVRHVPAQPVRFHVCLFQFFLTVQYKQCLAARACKVSQKLFLFWRALTWLAFTLSYKQLLAS